MAACTGPYMRSSEGRNPVYIATGLGMKPVWGCDSAVNAETCDQEHRAHTCVLPTHVLCLSA